MNKKTRCVVMTAALTAVLGVFAGCSGDDGGKPSQSDFASVAYYCDLNGSEYTLTLARDTFVYTKNGVAENGKYKTVDGTVTFAFSDGGSATAEMYDGWMTFSHDRTAMRFYESKFFTVTYHTDGGTEMPSHDIKNGKTLDKPADPTRGDDVFIGWYTDARFSMPFMETLPVTGDIELYAKWATDVDMSKRVFDIKFDLGYDGAAQLPDLKTLGGKLYGVPTPEREGYTFEGWFVGMTDGALTYKIDENTDFAENTTLHALWRSASGSAALPEPIVSVTENGLSWDVLGTTVAGYEVSVTGPDNYSVTETVTGGAYDIDFANLPSGDYEIEVIARSLGGSDLDSEPAVRVYRNKGLSRVSLFTVDNASNLIFNSVENASKYIIKVLCNDAQHRHDAIDNGNSCIYNFSGCSMREDGIEFTVTAVAEGYVSSVSETFKYKRNLAAVESIKIDEKTDTVSWSVVDNATDYMVSVKCGNAEHDHELVDNGDRTYFSLAKCDMGKITVNVYPAAKGYWSPAPVSVSYEKKSLAVPSGLAVIGDTLTWNPVHGAASYTVCIGAKKFTADGGTSFDLSGDEIEWSNTGVTDISVVATSASGESVSSDVMGVDYYKWNAKLEYSGNTVSWKYAYGADSYEVRVNNGKISSYTGVNSAKVSLSRAGYNTVYVRYNDGGVRSAWQSVEVYAYAVVFDTGGVVGTVETQYVAYGDSVDLTVGGELAKEGYDFDAWYSTPGGAAANGTRYTEYVFNGAGTVTLYANYIPRTYRITLDYNGCGAGDKSAEVVYGSTFKLPAPTDTYRVFTGWYSNSGNDGIRYTDENGDGLSTWNVAQDITVYADWREVFKFTKENDYYVAAMSGDIGGIKTVTVPSEYKGADDATALPVRVLSDSSFRSCTDLVTVNIPNSITNIDIKAFRPCTSLQNINVYGVEGINEYHYESIDGVLFYNNRQTLVKDMWFYPMGRTETVYTLPHGVSNIPSESFYKSLFEELVIPGSVTAIQQDAFYDTKALKTLTFAEDKKGEVAQPLDIRPGALRKAANLEEIVLPSRYDNFDRTAFYDCKKLVRLKVNPGGKYKCTSDGMLYESTSEGNVLLYCPESRADSSLTIPAEITVIGTHAFSGGKIANVIIPATVKEIRKQAFAGYKTVLGTTAVTIGGCALKSVTFSGNRLLPLVIGESAFGYEDAATVATATGCTSLASVVFERDCNVVAMEKRAFSGCPIVTIELPNSLTSLGESAFAGCSKLTTFNFAQSDTIESNKSLSIASGCFTGCVALTSIKLPYYVKEFDEGVFAGCTKLANVDVDENNPILSSIDGVLFDKKVEEIKFYPSARSGPYTLPYTIKKIGSGVFQGKTGLTGITIGNRIEEIADNAFKSCTDLADVVFITDGRDEKTELKLGVSAFNGCTQLRYINLPSGISELPDQLFYNCKKLASINEKRPSVRNDGATISIPHGVTDIGKEVFYYCSDLIGKLTVPNTLENLGYRAFYYCTGLTEVEFESGNVETKLYMLDDKGKTDSAGNSYAFYNCTGLIEVKLPERLVNLGTNAFGGFGAKLERVNIPSTVTVIGKGVFYYCSKLTSVSFAENKTYSVTFVPATTASAGVFYNCSSLVSIALPEGITTVPAHCFSGCAALESVYLPKTIANGEYDGKSDQLAAIGDKAFYGCKKLTSLEFADGGVGGVSFGKEVFGGCELFTTLTLPDRLADRRIGAESKKTSATAIMPETMTGSRIAEFRISGTASATADYTAANGILYKNSGATLVLCPLYKSGAVEIPYSVVKILDKAFYGNTGITSITFAEKTAEAASDAVDQTGSADGLTIGGDVNGNSATAATGGAFAAMSLLSIRFPARLEKIDAYAFAGNVDLGTAVFDGVADKSARLVSIGIGAFQNCTSLNGISFPASMKEIGKNAFNGDTKLASAEFVKDGELTTLGDGVFQKTALSAVELPKNVSKIGKDVFSQCLSLTSVSLPDSVTSLGTVFVDCYNLQTISVYSSSQTPTLSAESSVLFNAGNNTNTLVAYPQNKTDKEYVVPIGVTDIAANAFAYNQYLETVYIPDTVKTVGEKAFYMCGALKNVYFENYTAELPAADGEETATPPAAKELAIGNYAFSNAYRLHTVELPKRLSSLGTYVFAYTDSLSVVTVESGCTALAAIGNYDFYYSGIKSFSIPSCVQKIGQYAFEYSGLTSITIPKSVTDVGGAASGYAFAYCTSLDTVTFEPGGTKAVTMRNYNFVGCTALTTVSLSDKASTTGTNAFKDCTSLTTVIFNGDGLKTIDTSAFQGCTSLTGITLAQSVNKIASNAFKDSGLTEFTYTAGLTSVASCFTGAPLARVYFEDGISLVTSPSFSAMTTLEKVVLPGSSSMTAIAGSAFSGCTELKQVTYNGSKTVMRDGIFELPNGITTINSSAFQKCNSMTTLILPDTVNTLGSYAFAYNPDLTSVALPNKLAVIGERAFRECTALENIDLKNVTEIKTYAFYKSGLTSLTVPASVDTIGTYAFSECSELISVEFMPGSKLTQFAASPTSISYAFSYCGKLTSVTLPDGLEHTGTQTFYQCPNIESISIPSTVVTIGKSAFCDVEAVSITFEKNADGTCALESIGDYAFRNAAITELTLPISVVSIGSRAFEYCRSLQTVDFDTDVGEPRLESIGAYAFKNCDVFKEFEIPASVNSIGTNPFLYDSLLAITLDNGNKEFSMFRGILYTADLTELVVCPGSISGEVELATPCVEIRSEAFVGSNIESVSMLKTGFTIGDWAFNWCKQLTKAEIGAEANIGESAFRYCDKLGEITLGESCTVGDRALLGCTSLTSLVIPFGTKLGTGVVDECSGLVSVDTTAEAITVCGASANIDFIAGKVEITIVDDVPDGAFKGNLGITSVILAEGVTSIGKEAFQGCYNLENVKFPSTLTTIGQSAFEGDNTGEKDENGNPVYIGNKMSEIDLSQTSVTSIGNFAFRFCTNLKHIEFPAQYTKLGMSLFVGTGFETFEFQNTIESLGGNASSTSTIVFLNAFELREVSFEAGSKITVLPYMAFSSSFIKRITLPENLETIGSTAFWQSTVESIVIPRTVTRIYEKAFKDCPNLKEVIFEEGSMLTNIGASAFENCPSLTDVRNFPAGVTTFGSAVFKGCTSLENIDFATDEAGKSLTAIGANMFENCKSLSSITLPDSLAKIDNNAFLNCTSLMSITIPSGVTIINTSAFSGCTSLSRVVFEKDVSGVCELVTISNKAFENCAFTAIDIPDSVTSLGSNAFAGTSLVSIRVPNGVTSGGTSAFEGLASLETVILPEGMTSIGSKMFKDCTGLKSIVIPSSVTAVLANAFEGWTEEQTIYMTGIKGPFSTWNIGWKLGCNADIVWDYTPAQSVE